MAISWPGAPTLPSPSWAGCDCSLVRRHPSRPRPSPGPCPWRRAAPVCSPPRWCVVGGLECAAGIMVGILVQTRSLMGLDLLLPMFAAAILGGIGSVPGAVAGGLIIGVSEAAGVQFIGAEWRAAVAFIILMAVL